MYPTEIEQPYTDARAVRGRPFRTNATHKLAVTFLDKASTGTPRNQQAQGARFSDRHFRPARPLESVGETCLWLREQRATERNSKLTPCRRDICDLDTQTFLELYFHSK